MKKFALAAAIVSSVALFAGCDQKAEMPKTEVPAVEAAAPAVVDSAAVIAAPVDSAAVVVDTTAKK